VISAISATFLEIFSAVSLGLGSCFVDFAVIRGAVLWISAVSATFFQNFSSFWAGLGSCFVDFSGFSYFFPEFFQLLGWIGELF